MNPALRRSAAHAFVASLAAPILADDDRHHLQRVLRLRVGEIVSVSDGSGSWRLCRFGDDGSLVVHGEIEAGGAAVPPVTVGFALPKGDRPEWIVQKLTEIGVDRIVLVDAARSNVHWDSVKAERNLARLGRVARESSMQCRRTRLPEVSGPWPLAALIEPGVAAAEPDGAPLPLTSAVATHSRVHTVLVGPEGGWTAEELATVADGGGITVGLGATILRVETAALVAASRLTAWRDGPATV